MLSNECHSVLTYQSIRFYSHLSAAVEKKIDIISKPTKTTIWGGRGGVGWGCYCQRLIDLLVLL